MTSPPANAKAPRLAHLTSRLPLACCLLLGSLAVATRAEPMEPGSALPAAPDGPGLTEEFPSPARLKLNPDLDRLLSPAAEYAAAERYDLAVSLWQQAIDQSADSLVTHPDWRYDTFEHRYRRYLPVATRIEPLVQAGAALSAYRLAVDSKAQALLSDKQSPDREAVLSELVRRYRLSAPAAKGALELAGRMLDRHDFVGAARLLTRTLELSPESTQTRAHLQLRLAVAHAYLGETDQANRLLDELNGPPLSGSPPPRAALEAVRAEVKQLLHSPAIKESSAAPTDETPASRTTPPLAIAWRQQWDLAPASLAGANRSRVVFGAAGGGTMGGPARFTAGGEPATAEAQLAERWESAGWQPTASLRMAEGRLYYQTAEQIVCCQAATGQPLWQSERSGYPLDLLSQFYAAGKDTLGLLPRPRTPAELFHFGDRAQAGLVLAGGRLFALRGPSLAEDGQPANNLADALRFGVVPRRARENQLAAYDADSGRLLWRRDGREPEDEGQLDIGLLSAGTPAGNRLLVPVTNNGQLWLAAWSVATGRTVWRTQLCDEPLTGCSPLSPVGVTVAGSDIYVCTGAGLLFALDRFSGAMRWALRYARSSRGPLAPAQQGPQLVELLDLDGWDEDRAIVAGARLLVMPSDFDHLFAVDRRDGRLLWHAPRVPSRDDAGVRYALGLSGGNFFVAGRRVVRAYDVVSGRLAWQQPLENSLGRGQLAGDSLYLPDGTGIRRLSAQTGKPLTRWKLPAETRRPLGNLFVSGQQFFMAAPGEVTAWQPLPAGPGDAEP